MFRIGFMCRVFMRENSSTVLHNVELVFKSTDEPLIWMIAIQRPLNVPLGKYDVKILTHLMTAPVFGELLRITAQHLHKICT